MVDGDEAEPGGEATRPPRRRRLSAWERAVAGGAGVVVVAAGFATLFLAKNNGAVAVAVIFAGGVLLIVMAVQGTPMVKLGAKDFTAEMSPAEVAERAEQIAVESPAEAQRFIEGAVVADPSVAASPNVQAAIREIAERAAFRAGLRGALVHAMSMLIQDFGQVAYRFPDERFLIVEVAGHRIAVEGIFFPIAPGEPDSISKAEQRVQELGAEGLLNVLNSPGHQVRTWMARGRTFPTELVQGWSVEDGAAPLADGIRGLLQRLDANKTPPAREPSAAS